MYTLLQITLIASICWLLIVILKHTRPHIIQRIICIGLCLCIILPVLTAINAPYQIHTRFDTQPVIYEGDLRPITATVGSVEAANMNKTAVTPPNSPEHEMGFTIRWNMFFLWVWLFGFALNVIQRIKQMMRIKHMINTADIFYVPFDLQHTIKKRVVFLTHTEAKIPFLFVHSNIYVVLPTQAQDWDKQHLNNVILHELCHYRRKDHWFVWLSLFASALYWFHPIIRLLIRKHRQYIELACDQQLLSEGVDKHQYAESLILVTNHFRHNDSVIGMATEPHLLSSRVHSIIISSSNKSTSFKHKVIITAGAILLVTAGCIKVDQAETVAVEDMIELVSHDLPLLRNQVLPKGDLHISAFYDGHDHQDTYFHLQLENQKDQKKWVRLGPLKKFKEHVHTWHFRLSDGVNLTGHYKISGVDPDGVVDGVAVGLASLSHSGEFVMLKTQGPVNGEVPNVVCSWPLWIGERKFNNVLPQLSHSKPESVQRLLCGSQLMLNGEYQFSL